MRAREGSNDSDGMFVLYLLGCVVLDGAVSLGRHLSRGDNQMSRNSEAVHDSSEIIYKLSFGKYNLGLLN